MSHKPPDRLWKSLAVLGGVKTEPDAEHCIEYIPVEQCGARVEEAVWIATKDFKGVLNELQRRAIAVAAVEVLQNFASTTKAEG